MDTKESSKYYRFKLPFLDIRHGLLLYTLKNLMSKLGLGISPFYWVQEDFHEYEFPLINDKKAKYTISFLSDSDLKSMKGVISTRYKGTKIIGLKHNDQIAAFHCAEQRDFVFKGKEMKLKNNEVYLLNMYTFQNYRGRNLAPYLRHATYELLKGEGINTFYSISDYFNNSSHKFKKKLGAKRLQLFLSIALFNKYHRTFLVKTYN